jgi:hypothetical protein
MRWCLWLNADKEPGKWRSASSILVSANLQPWHTAVGFLSAFAGVSGMDRCLHGMARFANVLGGWRNRANHVVVQALTPL